MHESPSGRLKIGKQILRFFETDATAGPWFVKDQGRSSEERKPGFVHPLRFFDGTRQQREPFHLGAGFSVPRLFTEAEERQTLGVR